MVDGSSLPKAETKVQQYRHDAQIWWELQNTYIGYIGLGGNVNDNTVHNDNYVIQKHKIYSRTLGCLEYLPGDS